MPDSAPEREGGREAGPEVGASAPPPPPSGLTCFVVDGSSSAGISRETLMEAVRALLRERDYLRRARDLQLADFQLEAKTQREHVEELEAHLQQESRASREQAEELERELAALRDEIDMLLRERRELIADRDAWHACATRSLPERVRRKLAKLAGLRFRSSRDTDEE